MAAETGRDESEKAEAGVTLPTAHLRLGGEEFRCSGHIPQWRMMKMVAAYQSGDMATALSEMVGFLETLIDGEEWARFDAFLNVQDFEDTSSMFNALDHAIGGALAELAGRGNSRTGEGSPSPSSGGSPSTPPTSRVVSLSRGTDRVVVEEPSLSDAATSSTG